MAQCFSHRLTKVRTLIGPPLPEILESTELSTSPTIFEGCADNSAMHGPDGQRVEAVGRRGWITLNLSDASKTLFLPPWSHSIYRRYTRGVMVGRHLLVCEGPEPCSTGPLGMDIHGFGSGLQVAQTEVMES